MLVLDTDHYSEWERGFATGRRLRARMAERRPEMAVTVITVEEQMRGWLAGINRDQDLIRQIVPYAKLRQQVENFADWLILPWDAEAAESFTRFRREGVRIGSLDLKIACVVPAYDATLLTRNARDFAQVPGLRFENWLE